MGFMYMVTVNILCMTTNKELDLELLDKEYDMLLKSSNALLELMRDACMRSKKLIKEYQDLEKELDR